MIRVGITAGLLSLAFVSGMYVQAGRQSASARPLLPPLALCVTVTPAPFTTYTPTPLPTPAPFTTYTPTPALSK